MEFEKCETCVFWEENKPIPTVGPQLLSVQGKVPKIGACHLNPPETKIVGNQMQSIFTMTAPEGYCSHHPKNKQKLLDN